MSIYKCKNCGHTGNLIFQFTSYSYCVATNEEEPEWLRAVPEPDHLQGDAEIGNPVGCPECNVWGEDKFELIDNQEEPNA